MSYPGYPGQGYGGAGPSYPPYPNSSAQPTPPQHSTVSLSYPSLGFNPSNPYTPNANFPNQQYQNTPSSQPPPPYPQPPYPGQFSQVPSPYPATHQPHLSPAMYPPVTPYPPSNPYPPPTTESPCNPYPIHSNPYAPNPYPSMSNAIATQPHWGHNSSVCDPIRKGNPTVHPFQSFDPRSDAEILRKAMKGFGTDEKAIINVLAYRSNVQRQDIALQFKTLYGKDLISDLKSELSGKFEDLVVAMMKPRYEFLAKEVHDAIAGLGTEEDVIIEVICTATNQDIHALKAAYNHLYRKSLEEDLRGDTSGNFKRLMTSLCMGNRSEDFGVNMAAAEADAQALLRAGELRVGTDESTFNAILCQRSYPQLQAIMAAYQRVTGHSLEKAVKKEFSGDVEDGLVTIIKCVENRPGFFAERLYKSMKGMGTDDRALIRLVVSRCEVDMADIKQAFCMKYGKTLESFISGDASGDYKKCLLALIGA